MLARGREWLTDNMHPISLASCGGGVAQNIIARILFLFLQVFGQTATQRDLYDQAIHPIVNTVLEGFSCTIFAYGSTGTGKTYTMEGECRRAEASISFLGLLLHTV